MRRPPRFDDGTSLLIYHRFDPECQWLQKFYEGLRFNRVQMTAPPAHSRNVPAVRNGVEVMFNVSGTRGALEAHGFAHSSWWSMIPSSGVSHLCSTAGFGRAWYVTRTEDGYRLQRAVYVDGVTKLNCALHLRRLAGAHVP